MFTRGTCSQRCASLGARGGRFGHRASICGGLVNLEAFPQAKTAPIVPRFADAAGSDFQPELMCDGAASIGPELPIAGRR